MAQIVSREEPQAAVSVAELLRRCASTPELDPTEPADAAPIPVGALLRREGRRDQRSAEGRRPAHRRADGARPVGARTAAAPGRPRGRRAARRRFGLRADHRPARHRPPGRRHRVLPGRGVARRRGRRQPDHPAGQRHRRAQLVDAGRLPLRAHAERRPARRSPSPPSRPLSLPPPRGRTPRRRPRSGDSRVGHRRHPCHAARVAQTTKALGDTVGDIGQNTPLSGVTTTVGNTVTGVGTALNDTTAPVVHDVVVAGRVRGDARRDGRDVRGRARGEHGHRRGDQDGDG